MSDSVVEFPDEKSGKHPTNPVESRSARVQALELLESEVARRPEGDRLDMLVFRALLKLSREQPEQSDAGFTPLDVADAVGEIRGRVWSDPGDKERIAADVRKHWKKLLREWQRWQEGFEQVLIDHGIEVLPRPEKSPGGGMGRMSRYRLDWVRPVPHDDPEADEYHPESAGASRREIRYICEDIDDAGVLARVFARGFHLSGWRRWAIVVLVAVPLLASLLLFFVAMLGVINWSRLETAVVLQAISSFLIVLVATWICIGPVFRVVSRKIVKAPWWMQDDDDSRLLEHRNPPRYSSSSIHAVRYAGVCPVCRGRVLAKSGGLEFWGRLVGRCAHAPVEHVFSFDHVSRSGTWLRGVRDPARAEE